MKRVLTRPQLREVAVALVLRLKLNGRRGDGLRDGFRRGEERACFAALRAVRAALGKESRDAR